TDQQCRLPTCLPSQGGGRRCGPNLRHRRDDLVITAIKRRPDQVVHSGIDDYELFDAGFLDVTDAREQDTSVADKEATRFDQNANIEVAHRWYNRVGVIADTESGRFAAVIVPPLT